MIITDSESDDFRTPNEIETLRDWKTLLRTGTQWQLWHRGKYAGVFMSLEDAFHEATEHLPDYQDYSAFHLRTVNSWKLSYNLEIQSPSDKRWMTSPTFFLQVSVG